MNINPSKCLRQLRGLFFIFILFFSGMAQASVFQKMNRSFLDISQSKAEEVFSILDDLDVEPMSLSRKQMRVLTNALDDPTDLLTHFPRGLRGLSARNFLTNESRGISSNANPTLRFYRLLQRFLFSRFDLHKHSDTLFTKLFSKRRGRKWEELPFQEAKKNWENFFGVVRQANDLGYNLQFTDKDLEAAAISFIHQRFSDKYSSNINALDPFSTLNYLRSWEEQSLGMFFHRMFTIDHYISPHYTLNAQDSYNQFIMNVIFLHHIDPGRISNYRRSALLDHLMINFHFRVSMNSKEFVLKIWNDIIKEINAGQIMSTSTFSAFLTLIVDSVFECRRFEWKPGASMESHPFLKAMVEASREDDRLTKVVDIIDNLVFQDGTNQEIEEQLKIEIANIFVI